MRRAAPQADVVVAEPPPGDARSAGAISLATTSALHYGYQCDAWQRMVNAGLDFLRDLARAAG